MTKQIRPFAGGSSNDGEEQDDWIVTYADAITLLLAFFIILVAISTVDPVKYEQMRTGIAKSISKKDVKKPMVLMNMELQQMIDEMGLDDAAGLSSDAQGLKLEFASAALYQPGSATLKEEAIPVLRNVAGTLTSRVYENFRVEVQGHTDNTPINTRQFPSNWELSAERATRVTRTMVNNGVASERMKAIAFADTAPKVPNTDMNGNPLPENQAINRRVVLRIYPR